MTTAPSNTANMSDDSSELSSVPSEDDSNLQLKKKGGILKFFSTVPKNAPPKKKDSPPPPERSPSPPHEYVLSDNGDIAFIVMFRSRFSAAFPKSLTNFGPQEIERGIVDTVPGLHVESLLCALLGLLLNRKQDVKYDNFMFTSRLPDTGYGKETLLMDILSRPGHYNRALEEAVQTHKAQWAKDWESKNPLSGGATFTSMTPTQRLTLLRTLILWCLSSSDVVRGIITNSYKQNRQEDDLNQPLSIQPWGSDSYRRRYFLIEGQDDTAFRVYRESNPAGLKRTWWSVAGDIDELRELAEKLNIKDGGQKARVLSAKILAAIPRFEATEEKRKRREYRQMRKQAFKRPEPNFSMYEGRTRGKRMKYTYSDDEDGFSSETGSRRSTRNTGTHTPAEPTITQSGRQVRSRLGGAYGETVLSAVNTSAIAVGGYDGGGDSQDEDDESIGRRPRRAAASNHGPGASKGGRHIEGYNSVDDMDDEDEDDASEQDYGDDEEEEEHVLVESEEDSADGVSEDEFDQDDELMTEARDKKTLVVKLPIKTPTPERQTAVKPNLNTETSHDRINVRESIGSVANNGLAGANTTPKALSFEIIADTDANPAVVVPDPTKVPAPPVLIVPNDAVRATPSPMSPSLAYRGSPDKSVSFPQPMHVSERIS